MSDEDVIKQMIKSKAEQALREHVFKGESLDNAPEQLSSVAKDYMNMSESEKQAFMQKGWKNG